MLCCVFTLSRGALLRKEEVSMPREITGGATAGKHWSIPKSLVKDIVSASDEEGRSVSSMLTRILAEAQKNPTALRNTVVTVSDKEGRSVTVDRAIIEWYSSESDRLGISESELVSRAVCMWSKRWRARKFTDSRTPAPPASGGV